jgi:aspartate kinase
MLREGINVQMMSQGASKVNISLVIDASDGQRAVKALHGEFFGGKTAAPAS